MAGKCERSVKAAKVHTLFIMIWYIMSHNLADGRREEGLYEKIPAEGLPAGADHGPVCGDIWRAAGHGGHGSGYGAAAGGGPACAGGAGGAGTICAEGLFRSGVYNALVVVVSMVLPLPAALAVNGVGTAVCLSISYAMGRFTKTESLESVLDRHPKIKRYFSATQEYGFAMCFAIHMLGLNMEVLGLLLGMLRVDYLTYLAGSWLAIAPGMVCLVIAGNSLDFSSPVFWVFLAINTVLVVCSVVYTLRKLRAAKAKGAEREE